MRRLGLAVVCVLGCYEPTLAEGQFTCSLVDSRCPSGFTCDPCTLACVKSIHACQDGASLDLGAGADLLGTSFADSSIDASSIDASSGDQAPATDLPADGGSCGSQGCCCTSPGCDLPDDAFTDSNCDGIDGDAGDAIFVDPWAGDDLTGTGTRNLPLQHLNGPGGALAAALAQGKHQILVGKGTLSEDHVIVIASGISIYGGYDPSAGWLRSDAVARPSIVVKGDPVGASATGLAAATHWDRVNLSSSDAINAGTSAYGLWVVDSGTFLTVSNASISGGQGGSGADAVRPNPPGTPDSAPGHPAPLPNLNCCGLSCPSCDPNTGGTNTCAFGGAYAGGAGGSCGGSPGAPGAGPAGPGTGGAAGADGSIGATGGDASGTAPNFGSVDALGYHPSLGVTGGNGSGGSGGGGGPGQTASGSCKTSGPSGGAGGCGGLAAPGGPGGGGSFGAFFWSSSPTLRNVKLTSGAGGEGGFGAQGGFGGAAGGKGGTGAGDGGAGGWGGASGGGPGGPSICLEIAGGSSPTIVNPLYVSGAGGKGGYGVGTAPNGPAGLSATTRTD